MEPVGWWITLIVAAWLEASILVGLVIAAIGANRRARLKPPGTAGNGTAAW